MRNAIILFLCVGAIVAWQAWPETPASATTLGENAVAQFGFGLQVAGSYSIVFEQLPPFPRPPVPALTTINAEGTFTSTDVQTMFGDGNRPVLGFRSPIHGNWVRTGTRQISFTMLAFGYDEDGNLGSPSLQGGSMLLTSGDLTFSKDSSTVSGLADVEIFAPGQDPLDPESVPLFVIPISIEGRRIEVR